MTCWQYYVADNTSKRRQKTQKVFVFIIVELAYTSYAIMGNRLNKVNYSLRNEFITFGH